MKRVGIFSGTFDPVHVGHVGFALRALDQLRLDKVVFLPERSPRGKVGVGDFAHRVSMLQLVTQQSDKLDVLKLGDEQFTVARTLPELQRQFQEAQLVLLCGSDVIQTFRFRWPGLETLLANITLVVGLRTGESQSEVEAMLTHLHMPTNVLFVETPHTHVSATKVRAGKVIDVDPLVRDYITSNQLYGAA